MGHVTLEIHALGSLASTLQGTCSYEQYDATDQDIVSRIKEYIDRCDTMYNHHICLLEINEVVVNHLKLEFSSIVSAPDPKDISRAIANVMRLAHELFYRRDPNGDYLVRGPLDNSAGLEVEQ